MNKYESVILVKPTLTEEELKNVKEKFFNLVKDNGAKMLLDESEYAFVLKKTAYEVRKFNKAQYLVFQFEANPECLEELHRVYRISDEILKFMTVKIDDNTKLMAKFPEDVKEGRKNFKSEAKKEEVEAEVETEEVKEENAEENSEEKIEE